MKKFTASIFLAAITGFSFHAFASQSAEQGQDQALKALRTTTGTIMKVLIKDAPETKPHLVVACRPKQDLAYACSPGQFSPAPENQNANGQVGGDCTYSYSCTQAS